MSSPRGRIPNEQRAGPKLPHITTLRTRVRPGLGRGNRGRPRITINYHIGPESLLLAMGISEKSKVLRAGSRSHFITSARSLPGHSLDRQGPLLGCSGGHYRSRPGLAQGLLQGSLAGSPVTGYLQQTGRVPPTPPLFTSRSGQVHARPRLYRDLVRPVHRPVRTGRCGFSDGRCGFSGLRCDRSREPGSRLE